MKDAGSARLPAVNQRGERHSAAVANHSHGTRSCPRTEEMAMFELGDFLMGLLMATAVGNFVLQLLKHAL